MATVAALEMEATVTSQINRLFELVLESEEFGPQPLVHWFREERVSDEDLFRRLPDQVGPSGEKRWHLLDLDQQLKTRAAG